MDKVKMIKNAYVAIIALVIFTLVNLIGGYINDIHHDGHAYYGLKAVPQVIPFHLFFGGLFWLSCLPDIKIRHTWRLPLIRTVFWSLVAIDMFAGSESTQNGKGDFIDALIPPFCFFIKTITGLLNNSEWLRDTHFDLFGVQIIGIMIYQVIVLEMATYIVNKLKLILRLI